MDDIMYNISIKKKSENQFFFPPRYSNLKPGIQKILDAHGVRGQFCVFSSGTTSQNPKGYAFSFEALYASANAVNEKLKLKQGDRWGLCLPPYYIGGLSVYVRSLLLDRPPAILHPWNPDVIIEKLLQEEVTAISLVPAQVFDLVKKELRSPKGLKSVLVGGDFLGDELEARAQSLGWPIIRTYGMTEVASGLAIGGDNAKGLELLPHQIVKTDTQEKLWVKSKSLYTCEFQLIDEEWQLRFASERLDNEGFYPLSDRAALTNDGIIPLGRDDGSFKSSGHLIPFYELKNKLDSFMVKNNCWGKMDFLIIDDERRGKLLKLIFDEEISDEILGQLEKLIEPIRIDLKQKVKILPKTELGKTKSY